MSFLYKVIFALLVFIVVGGITLISVADISIKQDEIVKEVSGKSLTEK